MSSNFRHIYYIIRKDKQWTNKCKIKVEGNEIGLFIESK